MEAQPRAPRIVAVTAGGPYPFIVINALAERFGRVTVLIEEPEPKALFLKRRARRVGWISTAGQFVTMSLSRFGKSAVRRREAAILAEAGIDAEPHPALDIRRIPSVNDAAFLTAVGDIDPQVIFIAGCRMLSRRTLAALTCPVINYHAGINPKYRGMMGGYWALATGDAANFGTTVHLVDAGVDTGGTLYQARMRPVKADTMLTYAMVQAVGSRAICVRAVEDALEGRLAPVDVDLPSRQWFHPPIWTYLWNGLTKGVW